MTTPRILAFAGSTRSGSLNKLLVQNAAEAAKQAGAEVTVVDLKDFDLPLFDEDVEATGTPAGATRLKQLFIDHDALLIASPEYNSSVSAVLKNAIDWVSRSAPGEPMKAAFLGKVAVLLAASPGGLGGLRGLVHLRSILQNISVMVLPDQFALGKAHEAFDQQGVLTDERAIKTVTSLTEQLVTTSRKLLAN
ncbi:MAG: NAD(P)H-dependent oxidoreductase [Fuerstiella sp.]